MYILPTNNNSQPPSFAGQLILNGKYNKAFDKALRSNSEISKLVSGEKDIVAKISSRKAKHYTLNHFKGETLYKLAFEARSANPTILDKIKSYVGLFPKVNLSTHYHSEDTIVDMIEKRVDAKKCAKALNIEI